MHAEQALHLACLPAWLLSAGAKPGRSARVPSSGCINQNIMKFEDHHNYNVPEIRVVLDLLVNGAKDILGPKFFAAWLQGSSATGHFDDHSDIDFIIGVESDLTKEEIHSLQTFHRQLYNHASPWAKHIEGSYIPREILRDYKYAGKKVWYLDHGSTTLERSAHDNMIAVKWILREKGVVLAGPDPSEVMNMIPISELRMDIYRTFADWAKVIFNNPDEIGNHFYQTFAVLSYSRMLNDIRCGSIGSKREGAEWVKANLDPKWHDLIDKAWLGRPNPSLSVQRPADPQDVEKTMEFIRICLGEARRWMISFGLDPISSFDAS
jgi:hypothetical protein